MTYFDGKTFKKLASSRSLDCFVIRFNGKHQSIEFVSIDGSRTTLDIVLDSGDKKGALVYMFAGHHDTTFQYFAKSLKPTDNIFFYIRDNGSQLTREKGLAVLQLRAVVIQNTPSLNTTRKEMTLKTVVVNSDYQPIVRI